MHSATIRAFLFNVNLDFILKDRKLHDNGHIFQQEIPRRGGRKQARHQIPYRHAEIPVPALRAAFHQHHSSRIVRPHSRHRHPIRKARPPGQADDQRGGAGTGQGQETGRHQGGVLRKAKTKRLMYVCDSLIADNLCYWQTNRGSRPRISITGNKSGWSGSRARATASYDRCQQIQHHMRMRGATDGSQVFSGSQ